MTKLLIVSQDRVIATLIEQARQKLGFDEATNCAHQEALKQFVRFKPTHVIVFDYTERESSRVPELAPGAATWRRLTATATSERLVRCGFEPYRYPNYIQAPFLVEDLRKLFHEGG